MSPIFDVRGLALDYGKKVAFSGVTIPIAERQITALVGPSGCGKTSFLMCLNRLVDLLPKATVRGSVKLRGEEILAPGCDVVRLRRRVGMIFQKPNPFPFSIRRNIDIPLREHGIGAGERPEILEAALRDVGLWDEIKDRLDESADALSGGQQQRLCIARTLALRPDVLLLDEPCSALDPIASGVVEDLIVELGTRYTVVIVTHNLAQARRIADDVAFFWMKDSVGRLVEHGPARQTFEAPRDELTKAYVGGARG